VFVMAELEQLAMPEIAEALASFKRVRSQRAKRRGAADSSARKRTSPQRANFCQGTLASKTQPVNARPTAHADSRAPPRSRSASRPIRSVPPYAARCGSCLHARLKPRGNRTFCGPNVLKRTTRRE
jgi:hypothetical protein